MNDRINRSGEANEHINNGSIRSDLDELSEDISPDIQLSEIGGFNDEGNFEINEDIKGKDGKGDYIEIRGKKYYENLGNERGLGYTISRDIVSNTDIIYIGNMNGNLNDGYGIQYFSDGRKYKGEWKDGAQNGHGFEVLNGATFEGEYENGQPKYGVYSRFKDGELSYTYEGDIKPDRNFHFHGNGKITYSSGASYEGEWKESKQEGKGIMVYSSGHVYDGDWVDGNRNGHGILTYPSGTTLEGDWIDDNFKEGYGIEIKKNGEKYEGDFLLDKNGQPKPFCYINEDKDINVYRDWKERLIQEGNTQPLSEINMRGKRTFPNGNYHEFKLTNGSISEKSNDFITMYGDNKPDEDRSAERGNIEYTVKYSSESHIEYRMASRKKNITRKLEGGFFKFENKKGEILSIPKVSDVFEERDAMHAANLINSVRHINENAHNNGKYRYSTKDGKERLHATSIMYVSGGGFGGTATSYATFGGSVRPTAINGTILVEDVKKHFGGISAKTLAEWLNGGY